MDLAGCRTLSEILEYRADTNPENPFVLFDDIDDAVIGVPDPIRDESIVAVVVPVEGESPDSDALIAWCKHRPASFRVPERIEFRRVLPRTSVGKIQKHVLRADSVTEK